MATTTLQSEKSALQVELSIDINASPRRVWDALLAEIGPRMKGEKNKPMQLQLEPRPGGRLYRDLGNDTGHLWGHVQVIKPPTLLEITGPLFMSYPAINHLQFQLTEQDGGNSTRLKFLHRAHGDINPQHREGVSEGWWELLESIRDTAEGR